MRWLLGLIFPYSVFSVGCLLGWLCLAFPAFAGETLIHPGATVRPDTQRLGFFALFSVTSTNGNVLQANANFIGRLYGGFAQSNAQAFDNRVDVADNVTIAGNIFGGYVYGNGSAFNNTVRIGSGATVDITTEDTFSSLFQGVVGGRVFGNFQAYGNVVDLSGTVTAGSISLYGVAGGYSDGNGNVFDNTVILRPGSSVSGTVYGGYNSSNSASPSGAIHDNTVIIYGGTVTGDIYGGHSDATGAGVSSEADYNHVFIYGGTIDGDVYGGHSDNSSSDGNTIYLAGGIFKNTANGGISRIIGGETGLGGGTATGNTITIVGGNGLRLNDAFLYGNTPGTATWQTDGNTLVIDQFKKSVDGDVYEVAQFQNYHFIMSESMMSGDVFLNILRTGVTTDIGDTTIEVDVLGGTTPIQPGDYVDLFKTNGNNLIDAGVPGSITVTQGVSLVADVDVEQTADYLRLRVRGVHVNPDIEDGEDGHMGGVTFAGQMASLAAVRGVRSAWGAACEGSGWVPFTTVSGGSVRQGTSTSSHVDVDSTSVIAGLARRTQLPGSTLMLGGFVEAGNGFYDTSGGGTGDLDYYGAGVLSRISAASGVYTEASAQAGLLDSDYRSAGDTLEDAYGNDAFFTSSSSYFGAHGGVGYVWGLSEAFSLDTSTRYLWSRLGSDSVTVAGDPQSFEAVESHRWNTGARLDYAVTPQLTPYLGAGYEYEFDGTVRASVYGYPLPSHDMKGGTGTGELGVRYTPEERCGFSADVGVQGYTGTREGVGGNLQMKYDF